MKLSKHLCNKFGACNIILSSDNQPLCINKTSKVYSTQFKQVSSDHAYKEGEGDKSLEYWREVQRSFFIDELKAVNLVFDETTQKVCVEFEVIARY
ncbi:ASCH domain-containing protein [Aerococcus kribbianus]|uniref:ASCH domain-containing protein n=1 Tax=Aerococcus kribbianus TaxID=2999064 RepID=A0A9X3FNZ3_9LACT|nr:MULTISPECIES: ASCH domain-containing protein [unclassified Aerococcus]MCZ0717805.1 ASCH domain-containing protein [Aerococcus sp. YH-aer221]MCZ0726092.1 ASCH domain-containing protein [Aerococcus sp. YH-aer222]